jgi:hypothetical protein
MRTRLVFAVMLLAVLIGCTKNRDNEKSELKPTDVIGLKKGENVRPDSGKKPGEIQPIPGEPPLPPPPETYPDTIGGKVAKALNEAADAALTEKTGEWRQALAAIVNELPKEEVGPMSAPRGSDATAERAMIDAAFERFWRADYSYPHIKVEAFLHHEGVRYAERGKGTYEEGRALAAKVTIQPTTTRIDQATADQQIQTEYIEANVTDGVRAKWWAIGRTWVRGKVQFRESLELDSTASLTVKLGGTVGEINPHTKGRLIADLVDLKAKRVSPAGRGMSAANVPAVVRIGSGVACVHYDPGYNGLLLVRDNPELTFSISRIRSEKVTVTLIRY